LSASVWPHVAGVFHHWFGRRLARLSGGFLRRLEDTLHQRFDRFAEDQIPEEIRPILSD